MIRNKGSVATALLVCLLAVCVLPAKAQRTVQIRDGEVRIDNKVVPPADLPQSLDVENVNLTLSSSGIDNPVFRIGEHYYVVRAGRLEELSAEGYKKLTLDGDFERLDDSRWYRIGFSDAMTKNQMRELEGKAAKIQELSDDLQRRPHASTTGLAEEMRQTAEMAAQMAAELPIVQAASYWDQVRNTDRDLYNQLVREWELELQINQRAEKVRQLSITGGDTRQLVEELRALLGEAFELKQTNRRREIGQLEQQLKSLEQDMKKREKAREAIVERRLRELIGQ